MGELETSVAASQLGGSSGSQVELGIRGDALVEILACLLLQLADQRLDAARKSC